MLYDPAHAVPDDPARGLPDGWRPLTREDLSALVRLENASEAADGERFPTTESDMAAELFAPDIDLATHSTVIATPDGTFVGWCGLEPRLGGATWNRLHVHGSVHPEHRGHGHGRALLAWAAAVAPDVFGQHGAAFRADLQSVLTVHAEETAVGRAHLQERCGYRLVRWYSDMLAPLTGTLPHRTVPAGYRLVPWTPERDPDFHAADVAAFEDHWASTPWSAAHWRHAFADDPDFRPDLSVGVEHDGVIVGYVMAAAYEGIKDDAGRRVAWLFRLGTRREHRRRGLAGAAMARVMTIAQRAGFATAGLDVDTENVTGAVRLYEGLGFSSVKRLALRAKTIRAAEAV